MSKLRVLSLFSGIGAFEKALANLGIDYELVGFSEIDKWASQAFSIIHNVDPELNLGDVTKIDKESLPDFDLLVGGSPCQSFSVAGKRKGFEDTRGTLFFDFAETLKIKQPKYFLFENVKGLVNHDKGNTLDTMIQVLCDAGYTLDFNVLNSKYFNVPQNRERIYIVGILNHPIEDWKINEKKNIVDKGKLRIQKNVENLKTFNFDWPTNNTVNKRLRDVLETEVDERFYISEEKTAKLVRQLSKSNSDIKKIGWIEKDRDQRRVHSTEGIMPTITANNQGGRSPGGLIKEDLNQVGYIEKNQQGNRVYDTEGVGATISSSTGGLGGKGVSLVHDDIDCKVVINADKSIINDNERQRRIYDTKHISPTVLSRSDSAKILEEPKGVLEEVRATLTPDRVNKRQEGRRFKENDEPAFTVNTQDRHGVTIGEYPKYRIRKLTPLECWRLQAFEDEDFYRVQNSGISNSQLYKMAGNSITVTVLEEIFKKMFGK